MKCHINCFSFSGKLFHSHAINIFQQTISPSSLFHPISLNFFLWHPSITPTTEVQHDRRATSQPAGGAGVKPGSRPSPEWRSGPHVDGGQDETAAEIHHQELPVLPEHQELQLLHLPDRVRLSLRLHVSFSNIATTSHHLTSTCRVRELSHHFSEMDPVRQKWIYTFFMQPFLSGDRVEGKAFIGTFVIYYSSEKSWDWSNPESVSGADTDIIHLRYIRRMTSIKTEP